MLIIRTGHETLSKNQISDIKVVLLKAERLVKGHIGQPNVALRVDADAMGHVKAKKKNSKI